MGMVGIEPTAHFLKGNYSTTELHSQKWAMSFKDASDFLSHPRYKYNIELFEPLVNSLRAFIKPPIQSFHPA